MSCKDPRALTPFEAAHTLAAKLAPIADGIRQSVAVGLGIRPYRVFLIVTEWSGSERGEGLEEVVSETEILPTPRVEMITNFQNTPFSAGMLERGGLKIDRVSAVRYTEDDLSGFAVTTAEVENRNFYWEVTEDGRGDVPAARRRCRFLGAHRAADAAEWVVYVERMDEDRSRDRAPGSIEETQAT
jgi:hypothetical protein